MTRYGQDTTEDLCKPLKIPIMRSFGLGCRGAAAIRAPHQACRYPLQEVAGETLCQEA